MNGKKAKLLRGLAAASKPLQSPIYQLVKGTERIKQYRTGATNIEGLPIMGQFRTGTLELPPGGRKLYKSLKKLYKHGS